ncbi:MAG TPA: hypothetical protein VM869_29040 [Enhygromyxa sp.]|nr:hypothetical protein [Enhygromyxa sp.]
MEIVVPLLATFVFLVASTVLLATVGRRRRRGRGIERRELRAIEGVIGVQLAELVAEAMQLRRLLEDAAASGREMLAIEVQLGTALRRPLWRQIEDANFGHELDRIRRDASAWLIRFAGLGAADRQIVELLGLEVEPIRALLEAERFHWEDDGPPFRPLRDRGDELGLVQRRLAAAIDCLRRIERELIDYRPGGYR